MLKKYKHHLFLLFAGICYSGLSVFLVILTKQGVDAFTQILWRCLFGALTSALVLSLIFKKGFYINQKELKYILVNSLILVGAFCTFILSIYLGTPIAKAVALVYAYPLSLVPLSFIFFKDIPTPRQLAAVGLSMISITLLLEVWKINNLTEISTGEILAFANSIFYSGVIISGKFIQSNTKLHPTKTVTYSMLFLVPLLWIIGSSLNLIGIPILIPVYSFHLAWQSWISLFALGFIGTTLAMTFLYLGLSKVKPTVAGLFLLTEPVWVTIWGFLLFNQLLTVWGVLGIIGIVISVLLV